MLEAIATWPPNTQKGQAIAAGQAAALYVEASKAALAEFQEEVAGLRSEIESVDSEASTKLDELSTIADQKLSDLTTRFDQNIADFQTKIDDISTHTEQQTSSLDELQESTRTSLEEAVNEFKEESDRRIDLRITSALDRQRQDVEESVGSVEESKRSTAELEAETRALTEETRNLAQSFARSAVAEDYRKNARNKSVAGWIWDAIGIAVGTIPLGMVLDHFMNDTVSSGQTTTSLALTRIGISIAAVGIAALCFQRGSSNHKESRIAKRTDLRVRTVHQFLANLDPEVSKAVLEGMADQIYLRGRLEGVDDNADEDNDNLLSKYVAAIAARNSTGKDEESPA